MGQLAFLQDLIFLDLLRSVKIHVNLICQVLEEEETVHWRSRPVNYFKIFLHIFETLIAILRKYTHLCNNYTIIKFAAHNQQYTTDSLWWIMADVPNMMVNGL